MEVDGLVEGLADAMGDRAMVSPILGLLKVLLLVLSVLEVDEEGIGEYIGR